MNTREGSSQIEAAFVFPLIVLIVAAFISAGSEIYYRVRESANGHYERAGEMLAGDGVDTEEIIRLRRYIR